MLCVYIRAIVVEEEQLKLGLVTIATYMTENIVNTHMLHTPEPIHVAM